VGTLKEWFNTAAFAAPNYGFYGDASVGSIRGPGYTQFNMALSKTFPIHDRLSTTFRGEAFNVLNHPNFAGPSTSTGSAGDGEITGAGQPRIYEFALSVHF
jgi:TonB dependent receptor